VFVCACVCLCDMLSGPMVCRRCVEDSSVPIAVISRGMCAGDEMTGMTRMVYIYIYVCVCVRACTRLLSSIYKVGSSCVTNNSSK
jgi:hypothetical protein